MGPFLGRSHGRKDSELTQRAVGAQNQAMYRFSPYIAALLGLAVSMTASTAIAERASSPLARALSELQASREEWRREDAAFRAARLRAELSKTEFEDYAAFVAGLRRRMLENCEAARKLGGNAAVERFDCIIPQHAQTAGLVAVAASRVRTEEEKRRSLADELKTLEAEIDESLLKRQQELRDTRTNQSASGSGSGGGAGAAGGSGGGAAGGKAGAASTKSKKGQAGAGKQQARTQARSRDKAGDKAGAKDKASGDEAGAGEASKTQTSGAPKAAGGPDGKRQDGRVAKRATSTEGGSDDDVVARQLREAAEKETDPILKRKLWEEYRKYKDSKK